MKGSLTASRKSAAELGTSSAAPAGPLADEVGRLSAAQAGGPPPGADPGPRPQRPPGGRALLRLELPPWMRAQKEVPRVACFLESDPAALAPGGARRAPPGFGDRALPRAFPRAGGGRSQRNRRFLPELLPARGAFDGGPGGSSSPGSAAARGGSPAGTPAVLRPSEPTSLETRSAPAKLVSVAGDSAGLWGGRGLLLGISPTLGPTIGPVKGSGGAAPVNAFHVRLISLDEMVDCTVSGMGLRGRLRGPERLADRKVKAGRVGRAVAVS